MTDSFWPDADKLSRPEANNLCFHAQLAWVGLDEKHRLPLMQDQGEPQERPPAILRGDRHAIVSRREVKIRPFWQTAGDGAVELHIGQYRAPRVDPVEGRNLAFRGAQLPVASTFGGPSRRVDGARGCELIRLAPAQ